MNLNSLVDTYCQAWSAPEPAVRAELLQQVWSPDAIYTDPSVHLVGKDALLAHIAAVQAKRPGAQVVRTSLVDVHHGIGRFAWHVLLPDGTALPEGLDLIFPSGDGRKIDRIIGFFGPVARR